MKRSSKTMLFVTVAIITCAGMHRFIGRARFDACGHRCDKREIPGPRPGSENKTVIHINP